MCMSATLREGRRGGATGRLAGRVLRACTAVGALLVGGAAAAAPLTTWVVPPLARVMQHDPPGTATSVVLHAARGEYEGFQVAVRGPAGGLTNVRVELPPLVGPAGRIPASALTAFLERYVDVPRSTYCPPGEGNRPGPPGRYPDPLVPMAGREGPNPAVVPFSVPAAENQPIWIDVLVPRSAAPGQYSGALVITADQGRATIPVELTVWAFELPTRPSLRSSFGLRREHRDEAHQALLVQHRVMPWQVSASHAPSLLAEGLNVAGLPFPSNQAGCRLDPAPAAHRLEETIARYPPGLDLYVYMADEPRRMCSDLGQLVPQLRSWAQAVHQTRAKTLVTIPPTAELLDDGTGRSAVDVWVLLPNQWNADDPAFRAARKKGDELWAYTALVQDRYSPKWAIDFAPTDYRVTMGFLAQSVGVQGILYWLVDRYGADPWSDVTYVCCGGRSFAGEGLLIYPGEPVSAEGPVPSMRLKWIREGVDDYDYVQLLRDAGEGELALRRSRDVASDWRRWSRDPAVLERARLEIGRELDRVARRRGSSR